MLGARSEIEGWLWSHLDNEELFKERLRFCDTAFFLIVVWSQHDPKMSGW